MNEEQRVREGYLAILETPFWLWYTGMLAEKRGYLLNKLIQAKSWEDVCRIQGGLDAIQTIVGCCMELEQDRNTAQ
ncbi:MAG: hypothetical protein RR387_02865 [Clostridiales bacterium]